jgi:hypothetical protein
VSGITPLNPTPVPARSFTCPNCGATVTVRFLGRSINVVCGSCRTLLDANDPNARILQQFQDATDREKSLIPLGSIGTWRGTRYEVAGFQKREIRVEGVSYSWGEYLLFNPYKGFRYLTEYNGHWNDATPVTGIPVIGITGTEYQGRTYRHFQTATARTTFVLGEFPWQVREGDRVSVTDYVSPPYVLSSEAIGKEITWTLGEYVTGGAVWKAFELPGRPPTPIGIYLNQPGPLGASWEGIWRSFAMLILAVLAVLIGNEVLAQKAEAFRNTYTFRAMGDRAESSFVTPEFSLTGRVSDVEIRTETNASNQWIYLNYALINSETGQAFDLGREISYYSGSDSDGDWSEGKKDDDVLVPTVPAGRYFLRVEPESDFGVGNITYTVTVTRDVPAMSLYLIALGALLLPPLLVLWRTFSFEQLRWAESDHPKTSFLKGGSD